MPALELNKMEAAWSAVSGVLLVPHTEKEYHMAVSLLDKLVDEVGENESHPLASLMEVLGVLIGNGNDARFAE